jgi:TM2 domain-containing membrane protein YozV
MNNVLAAIASAFIPGLGQLCQGRIGAAIGIFILNAVAVFTVVVAIGFVLAPVAWIYGIYDAATWKSSDQLKKEKKQEQLLDAMLAEKGILESK